MHLSDTLRKQYTAEDLSARQAQAKALEISQGPVAFQVSRLMARWGIFALLLDHDQGLHLREIAAQVAISEYAAGILLEASLSIGSVRLDDQDRFLLTKTGYFLARDPMVRVNMDFNHDVNYLGLFHLGEALRHGRPEGLQVFGQWSTIYEGLSELPEEVQRSWFAFDHFYSDSAFDPALALVFGHSQGPVRRLLDVGGNTGRWARRCVRHDPEVRVTIMDLPAQCALAGRALQELPEAQRIDFFPADLLDVRVNFPDTAYDAVWMSQFLDCFSMPEIVSILRRARRSLGPESRLYIMETLWDRQTFPAASYCLTMTSVYFAAMANGNSKMYSTDDLQACIDEAGLEVEAIHDGLGYAHSLVVCRLPGKGIS